MFLADTSEPLFRIDIAKLIIEATRRVKGPSERSQRSQQKKKHENIRELKSLGLSAYSIISVQGPLEGEV